MQPHGGQNCCSQVVLLPFPGWFDFWEGVGREASVKVWLVCSIHRVVLAQQKGGRAAACEVTLYTGIAPKQVASSDGSLRSLHGDARTTGRISSEELMTALASLFGISTSLVTWEKGSACIAHFAGFMLSFFCFHIPAVGADDFSTGL